MASGHTGNVVPRKGLRVRLPCPPLDANLKATIRVLNEHTRILERLPDALREKIGPSVGVKLVRQA